MCLQDATHFFTSGEAFARLILNCSGVPPSSPSSVGKYLCIHSCTRALEDTLVLKDLRSFSSTDFISPFLSFSLENMSSDRAVFITYSSALVMSVMELRRRQGTRNIPFPFPSVAKVFWFLISEVLFLFGVQGRIRIFSKRGRIFKRIWRLARVQRLIQWQTVSRWLSSEDITFGEVFGWSAVSPFELCLSLCECWGSSGTHWALSRSSSPPSWSPTSQTSNTCSAKVNKLHFYSIRCCKLEILERLCKRTWR